LLADLKEMYQNWPFFRETVDLIAMTLSKADIEITNNYEQQLIDKLVDGSNTNLKDIWQLSHDLKVKLEETKKAILLVTECEDLSNGFRLLQRSMKTRYPYVDPLNILQAETMKRLRNINKKISASSSNNDNDILVHVNIDNNEILKSKEILEDALIVTINGISQGMKNSG
jgi:phosphoenolpyruvate carboxylase